MSVQQEVSALRQIKQFYDPETGETVHKPKEPNMAVRVTGGWAKSYIGVGRPTPALAELTGTE